MSQVIVLPIQRVSQTLVKANLRPAAQPNLAEHSTNMQGTQTLDEVPNEQNQVDEEVSLAAEKLGLPDDGADDNESEESDYYSDFEEGS